MISMLIYDRNEKEGKLLKQYTKDSVALLSEEEMKIVSCLKEDEVKEFLQAKGLMDAAVFDVTDKSGVETAKEMRKAYEMAEMMVLSDSSISPMEYLTPSIRAASLLLRPFRQEEAKNVIKEFFHAVLKQRDDLEPEKVLVVENRQGKIPIPYSNIYYLEVREKKVFIRLKEKEYSKYETLDNMSMELPEQFLRCHRSFVVNADYIDSVKLSENMIYLRDGICVPLSRSYKGVIKEYMYGLRSE